MISNGYLVGEYASPQISRSVAGPSAAAAAATGIVTISSRRNPRLKPRRIRSCAPAPKRVATAGASTWPIADGRRTSAVTTAKAIE